MDKKQLRKENEVYKFYVNENKNMRDWVSCFTSFRCSNMDKDMMATWIPYLLDPN